jgi:hypothetical protein
MRSRKEIMNGSRHSVGMREEDIVINSKLL